MNLIRYKVKSLFLVTIRLSYLIKFFVFNRVFGNIASYLALLASSVWELVLRLVPGELVNNRIMPGLAI
jgi:hypothetical protein